MKTGVNLIGYFILLDILICVFMILLKYYTPPLFHGEGKYIYITIFAVFKLPSFYALWLFTIYWWEDTLKSRKNLSKACFMMVIGQFLTVILSIVCACIPIIMWRTALHTTGSQLVFFMLYLYCMGVTNRFYEYKAVQ